MMQLFGGLVLFFTLSTACGLKCFTCGPTTPVCSVALDCPPGTDRCFANNVLGAVTKGCIFKDGCIAPLTCCEGDMCNSATPSSLDILPPGLGSIFPFGSGVCLVPSCSLVALLVVSTAIVLIFL